MSGPQRCIHRGDCSDCMGGRRTSDTTCCFARDEYRTGGILDCTIDHGDDDSSADGDRAPADQDFGSHEPSSGSRPRRIDTCRGWCHVIENFITNGQHEDRVSGNLSSRLIAGLDFLLQCICNAQNRNIRRYSGTAERTVRHVIRRQWLHVRVAKTTLQSDST